MVAFNLIRQVILRSLGLAQERRYVIDSLPVPVVQFHLVPGSTGDWAAYGACLGKVASKKRPMCGLLAVLTRRGHCMNRHHCSARPTRWAR